MFDVVIFERKYIVIIIIVVIFILYVISGFLKLEYGNLRIKEIWKIMLFIFWMR